MNHPWYEMGYMFMGFAIAFPLGIIVGAILSEDRKSRPGLASTERQKKNLNTYYTKDGRVVK